MRRSALTAAGILLFYLIVEFGFGHVLDQWHAWARYAFEIGFAAAAIVLQSLRVQFRFPFDKRYAAQLPLALLGGTTAYAACAWLDFNIPFDFTNAKELTLFLLLGPVIEELVYRQALFPAMERLYRERWPALLANAALFAYSHFYAYFFVPEEFRPFILGQSAYAFLAGLWWARTFQRTRSVTASTALHVVFNFGFYLGVLALYRAPS